MSNIQCVWVQLYIEGQDNPKGNPVKIKKIPVDVADLMEEVHAKKSRSLEYCDASDLTAYATFPCSEESKLDSWASVPSNTTGPKPLIVVAPLKSTENVIDKNDTMKLLVPQQQQNQEPIDAEEKKMSIVLAAVEPAIPEPEHKTDGRTKNRGSNKRRKYSYSNKFEMVEEYNQWNKECIALGKDGTVKKYTTEVFGAKNSKQYQVLIGRWKKEENWNKIVEMATDKKFSHSFKTPRRKI
mmetsp:Transcript_44116/g.44778  ORF Transcript_44116/g.44778 Transcript_44116/m.44778 type:complete len:240 (+) Transcript_44116:20-739(+)